MRVETEHGSSHEKSVKQVALYATHFTPGDSVTTHAEKRSQNEPSIMGRDLCRLTSFLKKRKQKLNLKCPLMEGSGVGPQKFGFVSTITQQRPLFV